VRLCLPALLPSRESVQSVFGIETMLRLGSAALESLREIQSRRLVDRLDTWLQAASPNWSRLPVEQRASVLRSGLALGEQSGFQTASDLALFAKLHADLGEHRGKFFEHPKVREVIGWEVRNQGAKIYELFRLAEPIVRHLQTAAETEKLP